MTVFAFEWRLPGGVGVLATLAPNLKAGLPFKLERRLGDASFSFCQTACFFTGALILGRPWKELGDGTMKGSVKDPRAMREAMRGVRLELLARVTFVVDELDRILAMMKRVAGRVLDDDNVCRRRKRSWVVRHPSYTAEWWLTSIAM